MYKKAAEFWTELRVEILTATAFLANEKPISSQVWRLYWASHQVSYILRSWIFDKLCTIVPNFCSCAFRFFKHIYQSFIAFCFLDMLQRFFRHMCMSAKVPAAVRLAKKALMEDKCVVIGLQSTGEARTEEAVTKYVGILIFFDALVQFCFYLYLVIRFILFL